ncbi:MAG: D-glycero-beta-D-manno-heptose 1-phosphate adenylyltransferase [Aureispira sp.]
MNLNFQQITHKIQSWDQAQHTIQTWKTAGESTVFTNGCFDLLHYGHIHYLSEAASLGQHLIVGLNSTASVARLKGKHRPIKDEKSRLHVLASLEMIDLVVVFEQDTPLELIKYLQPDILVKGGDWLPKDIVGSEVVQANGGMVHSLAFVEGHSTTKLEQKILAAHDKII